ncbi:DUF6702 family protein [Pareuzebyella sediminis]|uniref:DUF6702 family protein n=1 Tax=Pareuzebyella sediminis TaxID=2607998 RepID=UPI00293917DF|nr:DUF6702 family protein [Pareuzebyella sediminis]
MKHLKKGLLILMLPLFAFVTAHKFYLSVTNVNYSKEDRALQVTSRIFIDDFEKVLFERYGIEAKLATSNESKVADEYIEKYFRTKLVVEINGENAPYTYIGKRYDNDVVICYIEVPNVDLAQTKSIQIENELLTDLFDEQQNIVHFRIGDLKKSFVLIKSDTKGMLNL